MRVAIVQETVEASRGGAETSTLEMAAALARDGADVTVLHSCQANADYNGTRTVDSQLQLLGLAAAGMSKGRRTEAFVNAVDEHCAFAKYEIVHAVTPCRMADVYQPRGGTYVETIERSIAIGSTPAHRWFRSVTRRWNFRQQFLLRVEREMLNRASPPYIAAVSEYVLRQVRDAYPRAAGKTRVIFNGVEIAPLAPEAAQAARARLRRDHDISESDAVVLFVAHNFKLKGLRELIHAASASSRAYHLVVAGRDRAKPYAALARRLSIADRLHFVGATTPVIEWFAAANLLCHPTRYDPCSRVVLEALCCGLPAVTTRCNGAAEAIDDADGLVVASPEDRDDLAAAIERGLSPQLLEKYASAAALRRKTLSMRRHAAELLQFYEEIVADRNARHA